jgi:hypothetical protein
MNSGTGLIAPLVQSFVSFPQACVKFSGRKC